MLKQKFDLTLHGVLNSNVFEEEYIDGECIDEAYTDGEYIDGEYAIRDFYNDGETAIIDDATLIE